MKHIIEIEKPKQETFKADIRKQNGSTSYISTIPSKIFKIFPQLKEDAQIVYTIKQVSIDRFECDITFQAKGLKVIDDKESASTIDEVKQKTTEKKPIKNNESKPAGNKLDVTKFDEILLADGKYKLNVTSPKNPQLRITGKTIEQEIGKKEIKMRVADKDEIEVRVIITAIKSLKNPDAKKLNDLINSYKPPQYRT